MASNYLTATDNKTSDFTYQESIVADGVYNTACCIELKPCIKTNLNSVFIRLNSGNNTIIATKSTAVNYSIEIPKTWFNNNNNILTIQVDTYDAFHTYIPGTYFHSIPLYNTNSRYENRVSNFEYPSGVYAGGTCIINILPPKDRYGNSLSTNDLVYEVMINCFGEVADNKIVASNVNAGRCSFVIPSEAGASCVAVYVTTIEKSSGDRLGTIVHSIPLGQGQISKQTLDKPQIILPEGYQLTITEGVNAKFKGTSTNINDYMIIYARKECDISEAVSKYTSSAGFYAAPKAELKQRLLDNVKDNTDYFILKTFDAYNSTFITQDQNDPTTFNIKTPETNDYENIEDFYALQWFKVNPSDLVYLYVIERKWIEEKRTETTTTVTSDYKTRGQINVTNWKCFHCDLADYRYWSVPNNWNPYGQINLTTLKSYFNQYKNQNFRLILSIKMDRQIKHPPDIAFNHVKYSMGSNYATPITNGPSNTFDYSIPLSYVEKLINEGRSTMWMHTFWGKNQYDHAQAKYEYGHVHIQTAVTTTNTVITGGVSYYIYSDSEDYIKDVTKIPISTMTPYIVVPPAVRPLELKLKNSTKTQATISYLNPLYDKDTQAIFPTYTNLGSITFDVSQGDSLNDWSALNTIDKTLYINQNERRLDTYEKKLTLPQSLLNSIKGLSSNDLYIDLNIKSIDNKPLNFKHITSSDIKMQLMFSKSGSNITRCVDVNSDIMDLKNSTYTIPKILMNKSIITDNDFDTIHLLYNSDEYDKGKAFNTENWAMTNSDGSTSNKIGWKRSGSSIGQCTFTIDTFDVARYALNYDRSKIRLCLENLSYDQAMLYHAPNITVKYKNDKTMTLYPTNTGQIRRGEDIIYEIGSDIFDVGYDDILVFTMSPASPYPQDLSDISFSNAYIEVLGMESLDEVADKYARGFTTAVSFFDMKKQTAGGNASASVYDPVQCVDIIMCCFDSNKNLINKTSGKRRDIFNGREFIYYTDRKWHSFVNEKYAYNSKYKKEYDMIFSIPSNTEYMFFIAFSYSNWHDNPSIYSMSNIVTSGAVLQDMGLQFLSPTPVYDSNTGTYFANSDVNNPKIELMLNSERGGSISVTTTLDNGFNLAEDPFDIDKWMLNPIIYSNNKKYGYEQPIFDTKDLYIQNNVVSSVQPLYNDIEYYSQWKDLYGETPISEKTIDINADVVDVNSDYTIYEDEGDKFISNKSVPYVELPAELINFDRSKITLFLDADFGVGGEAIVPDKFVTETYMEDYQITRYRGGKWGVKTLWTSKMMNAFEDVASIEDIKIEWGMKLNRNHTHPTEGRRGPILVEDLWVDSTQSYNYDPAVKFPDECKGDKIKDYGGHDIWHKNYGDYIYFEITNPRLKRLFLECNCHRRRHDAIMFEDYQYDWCWDTTVKVKFTVTRKVKSDGSPLYKKQNLGSEHYGSATWVAGWAMYQMPKFKYSNIQLIKAPTASDPTFIAKYDVRLSPVIFYYKNNPITGDSRGNVYKYTWGDNPDAYMKWETITVQGKAPYTHSQTHYYIAYELPHTVYDTFIFDIDKDGVITTR